MKTVLLLRGPVRLTETLLLGFLGDHDARVDLVPYVTRQDELCVAQGIVNPDRNSLILDHPLPPHIRRIAIDAALNETDVDFVAAVVAGTGYRGECQHSCDLLANGIRVVWGFVGRPMPQLRERAEYVTVMKGHRTSKIETITLDPGRAWGTLCRTLGMPV